MSPEKPARSKRSKGLGEIRIYEGCAFELTGKPVLWMSTSGPFIDGGEVPRYTADMSASISLLRQLIPGAAFTIIDSASRGMVQVRHENVVLSEVTCMQMTIDEAFFWAVIVAQKSPRTGSTPDNDAIIDHFKNQARDRFEGLKSNWTARLKAKKTSEGAGDEA